MQGDILNSGAERVMRAALTGLTTRQRVIGNNLANADTPGFKASRVDFEARLAEALRRQEQTKMATGNAAQGIDEGDLKPETIRLWQTSARDDGNNVDIDAEMVSLVETNITYDALVRLMSARLSLLKTIVSGGYR